MTNGTRRRLRHLALAGLLPCMLASAATVDPQLRNFIACPIVRDTSSVPCWLAEYGGELYFLTLQTDSSAVIPPPWLGHRVLVEGTRSDKPRICGGIVLENVHLSVVADLDPSCNQQWPAEERYNLGFEPPRPPGPSKGRLAFDTLSPPQTPPAKGPQQFTVRYDFNGMVSFRHPAQLIPVLERAQAVHARHILIEGHRGAALLSSGEVVEESADIARRRAEQVAELLRGAGLTGPAIDVRWVDAAPAPDGHHDFEQRNVTVTVEP